MVVAGSVAGLAVAVLGLTFIARDNVIVRIKVCDTLLDRQRFRVSVFRRNDAAERDGKKQQKREQPASHAARASSHFRERQAYRHYPPLT